MSKIYSRRSFQSTVTTGLRPFVPADGQGTGTRVQVRSSEIECPDCKSAPKAKCVSLITGKEMQVAHKSRQRIALRQGHVHRAKGSKQEQLDDANRGKDGYRDCPVCQRPVPLRKDGQIRDHRNLLGRKCYPAAQRG